MQCCTCSKWIHLRCSLLFFSRCRISGSSHSWSCPPCCDPDPSRDLIPTNTATSSPYFSSLYTSHCYLATWPIWSPSANAALQPHSRHKPHIPFRTFFVSSPSALSPPPYVPGCFSTPRASFSPLTLSGFFSGTLLHYRANYKIC